MAVDQRVSRRGIAWKPKRSQVLEAGRFVRAGLPIHARWLPFLPPRLRVRAQIAKEAVTAESTEAMECPAADVESAETSERSRQA